MTHILNYAGAVAAMLAAVGTFVATTLGILNRHKIQEVHVLVNSNLEAVKTRVDQLEDSMTAAGVDIPDIPGVPHGG